MSGEISGESLLQRQVLLRGIKIGRPIDLVLDLEGMRAVGLELRCGDDVDRFLPYAVARVDESAIHLDSPLQLVEDQDLAFYRSRGASLRSLQGLSVESRARAVGTLADVVLGAAGAVEALVVESEGERRPVPVDASLTIGGRRVASAA